MAALPDAEALCAQLALELRARIGPASAMVGIHTGGAWVAARLHAALGLAQPLGLLDIAFYRDDYDRKGLARDPKRSKIPFDVAGKDLLLVDDVLYTGRTVRAAVNELFDYASPAPPSPRATSRRCRCCGARACSTCSSRARRARAPLSRSPPSASRPTSST